MTTRSPAKGVGGGREESPSSESRPGRPRLLVYTCVIDRYDTVLPPVTDSPGIDFVMLTERCDVPPEGWRVEAIEKDLLSMGGLANRYHKLLPHRIFPDYDYSLYVDGNIRVLSDLNPLFRHFISSGCEIGIFRHPERLTVREEVEACIRQRKCRNQAALIEEYEHYVSMGFPDRPGLSENNLILRDHRSRRMVRAGERWWQLVRRFSGRDQISLPFIRWSSSLTEVVYPFHAREPNPYLAAYPHNGGDFLHRLVALVYGRRFDSFACESLSTILDTIARVRRS